MAEPARRTMTFDEFLRWDDGTETRYEFVSGEVIAMDPASLFHGVIEGNVDALIRSALTTDDRPRLVHQAGIALTADGGERLYVADLALSREPFDGAARYLTEPVLIVEILSGSTKGIDKLRKVPDYGTITSLREIWLVDQATRWVMTWRWSDGTWIGSVPMTGSAEFHSPVLAAIVGLDRIYADTGL
jgi:Uma2 family endonuclease